MCEISDKDLRSVTASFIMGSYSCGYALTMIFGALFKQWRFIMIGFGCLLILLLIGLTFIHDSPYWLLKKGRVPEALQAWNFYNPATPEDADTLAQEYQKLVKAAARDRQEQAKAQKG